MVQDGVLLVPDEISQVKKVAELVEEIESRNYSLIPATVTRVEPVGSGDRVWCRYMFNDEHWRRNVNRFLF